jgi:hypothetical protein
MKSHSRLFVEKRSQILPKMKNVQGLQKQLRSPQAKINDWWKAQPKIWLDQTNERFHEVL